MKWCIIMIVLVLTLSNTTADCSTSQKAFTCPGYDDVSDCISCPNYTNEDEKYGRCIDRKLFATKDDTYHFLGNDVGGILIWFVFAGIATACGVGGGGIYMPLGVILFRFSAKAASGLSQASIFGASMGGLMLNFNNKHPAGTFRANFRGKDVGDPYTRPLIDYNMVLFLTPMELAGATLGVLVQSLLPNWLYLGMASIILSLTAYKTYGTYKKVRAKEMLENAAEDATKDAAMALTEAHAGEVAPGGRLPQEEGEGESINNEPELELVLKSDITVDVENPNPSGVSQESGESEVDVKSSGAAVKVCLTEEDLAQQKAFLAEDAVQFPRHKIIMMLLLWVGIVTLTYLKGGKGLDSAIGVTCDMPAYGVLVAVQFVWLFGFGAWYGFETVRNRLAREAVGYPFQVGDVAWSHDSLVFYAGYSFLAGIVAGLIGIGGGIVLGPFLMTMEVNPRVSAASTATMVILTSSAVAVMYVIAGYVPWSYALFYFFVCLFGALAGKTKIDNFVKQRRQTSLLVAILAAIISTAVIGLVATLFIKLDSQDYCLDSFKSFC